MSIRYRLWLLFAPLLKPALQVSSNAKAYEIFVPGLLVLLAIFGGLFQGFGLIAELRAGVIERSRVTPVSRVSLLLVCGQGQWEDTTGSLQSTKRFAELLAGKGIRHELDLWGFDVPHDWPSWRAQLAYHLPRHC